MTKRTAAVTSGRQQQHASDGNEAGGAFVYSLSEPFTPEATDEKRRMKITELETNGEHERLLTCADEEAGYRGVIAVHSTALGPAVGGARLYSRFPRRRARRAALENQQTSTRSLKDGVLHRRASVSEEG